MLIYLCTGVDEFVLYDQGSCGNYLPNVCVLYYSNIVVSSLLHVLKLFCRPKHIKKLTQIDILYAKRIEKQCCLT